MYESARYRHICVNGRKIPEHVYVWEQAHGPKPEGCDIHHINGDGKDNRLENLVCLTKSEHKLLHAELKRDGVDPIDLSDPAIAAERERSNAHARAHRKAHLEEERAKDREEYRRNIDHKRELNRENYKRNRESIRASQAEYERAHTEERAARNAAYYAEHAEERKAYLRAYRAAHKEERAEKQRVYNTEHQDEIREYRAAYKAVHAANERVRRAVKRGESEETISKLREEAATAKAIFQQKQVERGKEVR